MRKYGFAFTGLLAVIALIVVFATVAMWPRPAQAADPDAAWREAVRAVIGTNGVVDASIAHTKLAAVEPGYLLVGSASSQAVAVAVSGDVTIATNGAVTIGAGKVSPSKADTALKTKVCCKDIEGFNASQQEYIFVAPYACTIVSIGIVSDTATTSSDAVTNWSFQVSNLTVSSNLLSSAKATSATEITGDALYDLGADQYLALSAGDVLEFQATKNDTPTDLSSAEIMSVVEFY